jgi:anti-sigma B factor antagonist
MQVDEKQVDGNLVIGILEPRLGADKAESFKQTIGRFLAAGNQRLILDLSRVDFIDSSGLGAILAVRKQLANGRELVICGATDAVASMFKLTRMDRVFPVYRSLEDALRP